MSSSIFRCGIEDLQKFYSLGKHEFPMNTIRSAQWLGLSTIVRHGLPNLSCFSAFVIFFGSKTKSLRVKDLFFLSKKVGKLIEEA